jgi:hypothetical protein
MDDASRWLTYPELAEARGISRLSAERLVRRRKWQRRQGNDGTTRIAVPPGEDIRPDNRPDGRPDNRADGRPDNRPDDRADISHAINALGEAVAVLREQLDRAEQGRIRAEGARDVALAQLHMAEELLKEAQIERAVEAAARRSRLFSRWRGRGG